jgi:hypothetical protein
VVFTGVMSDARQPLDRSRPGGAWGSGTVTAPGVPLVVPAPEGPQPDGPRRRRRQMLVFAGLAGAILAVGLSVILALALSGVGPFERGRAAPPPDVRPRLAQLCPPPAVPPNAVPPSAGPPSGGPPSGGPPSAGPPSAGPPSAGPPNAGPPSAGKAGPRTVDREAGISYAAYGPPWVRWDRLWQAGTLRVPYKVGQHFVTEEYAGGEYHASILSAAVPATDNDATTLNLECVGRQVAADVRAEYYPQPNTMDRISDGLTTLGGRPAYVSKFRLHFRSPGLTAIDELSSVAVIDVARPTAAVLYVSIPGTHRQWDYVVDQALASVRPL